MLRAMGAGTSPGRITGPALRSMIESGAIWIVAEQDGDILGVQEVRAWDARVPDVCEIATFVAPGPASLEVARKLFDATGPAARRAGYRAILASVAQANAGAQDYYRSRGFEACGRHGANIVYRFEL